LVLAVDEFPKPQNRADDLNLDGFKGSVESAVAEISEFFKANFQVDVKVVKGTQQTTKAAIQTYLNTEYVASQVPSVTIVFVLSHGFGHAFTEDSSELFIATSETDASNFLGSALEGTELVRKLARIPPRSSVFLFLDTCQSAAIDFGSISKILNGELAGRRFMVMAASDGGAKAYNFNFSRALIDLWKAAKSDDCKKDPDDIDITVQQFLDKRRNTMPKQQAQVVFPFDGEFCIESFGRERALAMLYNPGKNRVRVTYRESAATRTSRARTVDPQKVFPLSLRPGNYVLTITEDVVSSPTPKERSLALDLAANHVEFRPLNDLGKSSSAVQSLGAAQLEAASIAARWGAEQQDVWQLSQAGRVTLARIGRESLVPTPAKEYLSDYSSGDLSADLATNYAALSRIAPAVRYNYLKAKIVSAGADPYSIAVFLGQSGDYETANRLCLDEFSASDVETSNQFARCAIYNSMATGAAEKARQTRRVLLTAGKEKPPVLRNLSTILEGTSAIGAGVVALQATPGGIAAQKFYGVSGVYNSFHAIVAAPPQAGFKQ